MNYVREVIIAQALIKLQQVTTQVATMPLHQ